MSYNYICINDEELSEALCSTCDYNYAELCDCDMFDTEKCPRHEYYEEAYDICEKANKDLNSLLNILRKTECRIDDPRF